MAYNVIRAAILPSGSIASGNIGSGSVFLNEPAMDTDYIYISGDGNDLTKINRHTGSIVSSRYAGYTFTCNPVYYNGKLYCLIYNSNPSRKIIIVDPDTLIVESTVEYGGMDVITGTAMYLVDGYLWIQSSPFAYTIRISDMEMISSYYWPAIPDTNFFVSGSDVIAYSSGRIYKFNLLNGMALSCKEIWLNGERLFDVGAHTILLDDSFYVGYSVDNNTYNFGVLSIPSDLSTVYASIRLTANASTHFDIPYMSTRDVGTQAFTDNSNIIIWSGSFLKAFPYTSTNSMICKFAPVTALGFSDPSYIVQWTGIQNTMPSFSYYGVTNFGIGGTCTYLYNDLSTASLYTLDTIGTAYDGFSDSPLALTQYGSSNADEFTISRDDSLTLVDVDWSPSIEEWTIPEKVSVPVPVILYDNDFTVYSENLKRFGIKTVTGYGFVQDGVLSAILHGRVYGDGIVSDCIFEWGLTDSYGNETPVQEVAGDADGENYNYVLSNLTLPAEDKLLPSTIYHFRAKGIHPVEGTLYGEDSYFVTPGAIFPTATLSRVGSIKHVYDRTTAGIPPKFYMEVNLGGLAPEYMDAFTDQPITYVINRPPAGGAINGGRPDPVYPPDDSYNDYPPDYDPPWPDTSRPRNGGR